jgi:hypothetical protein
MSSERRERRPLGSSVSAGEQYSVAGLAPLLGS